MKIRLLTVFLLIFDISQVSGDTVTEQLHIQASIPSWLEYKILKDQSSVRLKEKDISEGYKNINIGTIISISTNSLYGYVLSIYSQNAGFFTSVSVTVENDTYLVSPGGEVNIHLPYKGSLNDTVQIGYKFNLTQEANAADYPWPIELTVSLPQ